MFNTNLSSFYLARFLGILMGLIFVTISREDAFNFNTSVLIH